MRRIYQERKEKGEFHLLFFFKFFRMNPSTYEKLLSWVGPFLKKLEININPVASTKFIASSRGLSAFRVALTGIFMLLSIG